MAEPYLDEIGDMPIELQAVILRVLDKQATRIMENMLGLLISD